MKTKTSLTLSSTSIAKGKRLAKKDRRSFQVWVDLLIAKAPEPPEPSKSKLTEVK